MKRDIVIIIALFSVAFLIRAAGVSNICMQWDEPLYWSMVFEILASNWVPTTEVFTGASPFFSYIGAGVTLLFGGELKTLRMISAIFGSLTVPVLYLFGKAVYDRKTGLLAALFLCFSAYHCFYSRIIMLEAFTIFLLTSFLYLFWLSQRFAAVKRGRKYAIFAGALMGLAISAKYLPLFLIPAVIIYCLWTEKFRLKALVDKRIILIFVFAVLFFSPLLTCLAFTNSNPTYKYAVETPEVYKKATGSLMTRGLEMSLNKLFFTGLGKMTDILALGAKTLTPTWRCTFRLSAILLFLITLLSYLSGCIKREKESSFLMILIVSLFLFIIAVTVTTKYYLMYSLPFYFVMLAHLSVKSFERLQVRREEKRENSLKNIIRIFVIFLTTIMLFSYLVVGVTSPYWDKGEYSWDCAIEFIKRDAIKGGYEEDILIGSAIDISFIDYMIYHQDLNASDVYIIKRGSKYGDVVKVDIEGIKGLKPNYLIMNEIHYIAFFKNEDKREIFKDYKIVFRSKGYFPFNTLVFKSTTQRTEMQAPELSSPMEIEIEGDEGKISEDLFCRSLPTLLKVGRTYSVLVQVKNTGDSAANFTAFLYSDELTVFVDEGLRSVNLNKGSIHIFKFKIVPIREHTGELPVTVDLYAKGRYEKDERWRKVDSCTDYVRLIHSSRNN